MTRRRLMLAALAFVLILAVPLIAVKRWRAIAYNAAQNVLTADPAPREPLETPLVKPKIIIRKRARTLTLLADKTALRTYRIALGRDPVNDKEREGDGRTPEGEFYITHRNPKSRFTLSLGLSYPNAEDAQRGLASALITPEERDAIVAAIEKKAIPPAKTALGGEIFIHGGGSHADWTQGCIALNDADIRELFEIIPVGTPVLIEP